MNRGDTRVAAPAGTRPAVESSGLSKAYGHSSTMTCVVQDVDLQIAPGEVLALLGPSGAGKTVLIKMLCGLVPPSAGTAKVGGFDVVQQHSRAVRHIGAVLEGSGNVYWSLSAWQNLRYFGRLKGLRPETIKRRAERLLHELGLWERRADLVGSFSRAMQQKTAIAAALIADPQVVLLDEPTIGLDVETARTVRRWVTRLARKEGKAVLLSTHQLALAEELADRVAVIRAGRIVADLPTARLLRQYAEVRYDIRVAEPLGAFIGLPDNATVETIDSFTRIVLPTGNRDALYVLLSRLHSRELPLISVNRMRPSLEEIFARLVAEGRS